MLATVAMQPIMTTNAHPPGNDMPTVTSQRVNSGTDLCCSTGVKRPRNVLNRKCAQIGYMVLSQAVEGLNKQTTRAPTQYYEVLGMTGKVLWLTTTKCPPRLCHEPNADRNEAWVH